MFNYRKTFFKLNRGGPAIKALVSRPTTAGSIPMLTKSPSHGSLVALRDSKKSGEAQRQNPKYLGAPFRRRQLPNW